MRYTTDLRFTDRLSKARYVAEKYGTVLTGRVLDVGADECHLRQHLSPDTQYIGLGLGGTPDVSFDLETGTLPFGDRCFDCVLCLDVLEHIENPHRVFDELCRVSRRYVVVSLPNAWLAFYRRLTKGDDPRDPPMRFYGLPLEPPEDRHKWFFSASEAERFLVHRAAENEMKIVQLDDHPPRDVPRRSLRARLRSRVRDWLFRGAPDPRDLKTSSVWILLETSPRGREDEP